MRLITESDAPVARDDIAAYEHRDDLFEDIYDRAAIKAMEQPHNPMAQRRQGRGLNTWEYHRAH